MPTSPLDPSHTTQFKSTIRKPQSSSSQSAASGSSSWPSSDFLSQASFDPASWTYLAEGGKSLLLRFDGDPEQAENGWLNHNGTRALALRVSKVPRGGADSSTAATSSSSSQGVDRGAFEDQVVAPLLGRKSLLPSSLSLKLPDGVFLEKVSGKIEMSRPKKRRAVDGIDVKAGAVEAIEDLTWCPPGDELLAVEIKPKWLFSSDADQPYSRYRKHQVLKSESSLTLDDFSALYEPLDLLSGDKDNVERATSGLVRDCRRGGNNLRLYANGQEVTVDNSPVLEKLLQRLNPGHQSSKSLDSDLSSTLALALCQPQIQSILQRLATLQADLAAVDIHTLSAWWAAQTRGAPFGAATSADSPDVAQEPALNEWSEFAQDWLSQRGETGQSGEGAAMSLRQAVLGTLLSATFKDCSLFLRLSPAETSSSNTAVGVAQDQTATAVTQGDKTTAKEAPYADEAVLKQINASKGARSDAKSQEAEKAVVPFGYTIRLIDLDVKPIEKLPYYLKLEDDIEKTFSQWKEKIGLS